MTDVRQSDTKYKIINLKNIVTILLILNINMNNNYEFMKDEIITYFLIRSKDNNLYNTRSLFVLYAR